MKFDLYMENLEQQIKQDLLETAKEFDVSVEELEEEKIATYKY